jgi:hypothetical protein
VVGCHKCQFEVQGFNFSECIPITSEGIFQDLKNLIEYFQTINQKNQKTLEYIQNLVNKPVLKINEIQNLNLLLQRDNSHDKFGKLNFLDNTKFIQATEIILKEKKEKQVNFKIITLLI